MELSGCSLYDLSTNWQGEPPRDLPGYGAIPDRLLASIALESITILQNVHARGCPHPPPSSLSRPPTPPSRPHTCTHTRQTYMHTHIVANAQISRYLQHSRQGSRCIHQT